LTGVDGYEVSYHQAFNDIVWLLPVGNVTTVTIASPRPPPPRRRPRPAG
jgi:hypothetical protein